ncbi:MULTISPECIES: LysE family translocator [Mycolicibacterium]|uniref:LysE family translocator n=1 Tax=Mycolicibacterium TaxID=1866885 RepID=UPI001CFB4B7C|nr:MULTISPECIES: LysE family translocator [Mycolicibacterium]MCX8557450.1 LysE family translocator [Mycolicibacterium mucogenicum]UCZ61979.1 LysE family translocator [Mycolicibacterium phocaicum]
MPSLGHLLAFGLISLLVIVVPGPSVLFTVGRALTVGRRQALLTVAGNAMGAYVQILAVALGAGALILASSLAFSVIKFVGAAYLIYLGVQAFRHRHGLGEVLTGGTSAKRPGRVLADGFVVGMTNPKTIVFFVAALPQVVDAAAGNVPAQMLVLGVVFLAIAVVSDSVWALAAGLARDWFAQSPRRFAAIGGAGGLAMVGLGISLAVTGRKD